MGGPKPAWMETTSHQQVASEEQQFGGFGYEGLELRPSPRVRGWPHAYTRLDVEPVRLPAPTAPSTGALRRWMPPGVPHEPLTLFRVLHRNPELASRTFALGAGFGHEPGQEHTRGLAGTALTMPSRPIATETSHLNTANRRLAPHRAT